MKLSVATFRDLVYVVDHLSGQNAAEQAILGNTPFQTLKAASAWLRDGAITAEWNGNPGFVFGIVLGDTSWFLATQAYFDGGVKAILEGRRFVKQMVTLRGGFVTFSRSPHPAAARWFKLVGMAHCATIGDTHVYKAGVTFPRRHNSVANSGRGYGDRHTQATAAGERIPGVVAPARPEAG